MRAESYDIKRDTWKNLPSLNRPRVLPALCLFRQRYLYCFGGLNNSKQDAFGGGKFVGKIERLDVREGANWEILGLKLSDQSLKIKAHSLSTV